MNNLNSVLLEGNVEKEPQLLTAPEGKSLCTFAISSKRYNKQGEKLQTEVSSFDVEVHGHLAEICGEYCRAGRLVRVIGRLRHGEEGILIVAEHVEFRPTNK